MAYEEVQAENFTNNNFFTGGLRKRLVLVLDCVTPHDFEYAKQLFMCFGQSLLAASEPILKLKYHFSQSKVIGVHQFATVFNQSEETARTGSAQSVLRNCQSRRKFART